MGFRGNYQFPKIECRILYAQSYLHCPGKKYYLILHNLERATNILDGDILKKKMSCSSLISHLSLYDNWTQMLLYSYTEAIDMLFVYFI